MRPGAKGLGSGVQEESESEASLLEGLTWEAVVRVGKEMLGLGTLWVLRLSWRAWGLQSWGFCVGPGGAGRVGRRLCAWCPRVCVHPPVCLLGG